MTVLADRVPDQPDEWRFTAPVPVSEDGLQYEVEFEVEFVSLVCCVYLCVAAIVY